jgi:HK97 gp10 family phage protein
MIVLGWNNVSGQIGELMRRYNELPRSVAKKHLQAAMKRAGKAAVPLLKKNTPKGGTRVVKSTIIRGEQKTNYKRRGGSLRRAATFSARYKGTNKDGSVVGRLGYKYGMESRKAIWLEFGTTRGIEPRDMMKKTYAATKGIIGANLQAEMAAALEKATNEANSPMNPRMSRRGIAAGVTPR